VYSKAGENNMPDESRVRSTFRSDSRYNVADLNHFWKCRLTRIQRCPLIALSGVTFPQTGRALRKKAGSSDVIDLGAFGSGLEAFVQNIACYLLATVPAVGEQETVAKLKVDFHVI